MLGHIPPWLRHYLSGLVLMLLVGCVAPLSLQRELSMPATYDALPVTAPLSPASLSHWWRRFNDPILAQLIERALAQNYDVLQSLSAVNTASARSRLVDSMLFPKVGYGASASRNGIDTDNALLRQYGVDDEHVNAWWHGLQASWETDLFGSTRQQLAAARMQQQASQAEVYATRLMIASSVAQAYFQFRGMQQRRQLLRQGRDIAHQFVEISKKLLASGDVQRDSVWSAESEQDALDAQLHATTQADKQLRLLLEQLCRVSPGQLSALLGDERPLPVLLGKIAPGQPLNLLARRPDLMAFQAQVKAAVALSESARRDMWPSISLNAAILRGGLYMGADDERLGLTDLTHVGAMFELPLLDFGSRRARISLTDSQAQQLMLRYEQRSWQALFEVEQALSDQQSISNQLSALRAAAAKRHRVLTAVQQRFAVGDAARPDILQAQRDWLREQDAVLRARVALLQSQLSLYKALGGGWRAE